MESFGESGAYLWGALLTRPRRHAARRRAGGLPRLRHLGAGADAGRGPLVRRVLDLAHRRPRPRPPRPGRTFAAYCYNEQAENRWLLASARRFAGRPGIPTVARGRGVHRRRPLGRPVRRGRRVVPLRARQGAQADRPGGRFRLARPRGRRGELHALVPRRGRDGRRRAGPRPAAAAAGVQRRRRRGHPGAARVDDLPRSSRRCRWPSICSGTAGRHAVLRRRYVDGPPVFGVSTPLRRGCSVRDRDPKLFPGSRGYPARDGGRGDGHGWVPVQRGCGSGGPDRAQRRCRDAGCWSAPPVSPRCPCSSGIGAPAAAAQVVPTPVPDARPHAHPRGGRGAGQAKKGRAAQGRARRRRPARLGHRAAVRPRPRGPLRGDVQAAAGLQPAGRPAHRAGPEDERRQGAAQRRQGQRRRVRQRDDAGRLHLLRPVRRPRHDARQDPAHPAEAGPAGDGQLRHPEVRPRQRLRQGPHGQPRALRPGQARATCWSTRTTSCSTCPATASARPTSATRATTRT